MAVIGDLGITYLDGNENVMRRRRQQEGVNRLGDAVQVVSLQLPRILGQHALAPAPLLRSQGATAPGLSGRQTSVGGQSGLADMVARAVLGAFPSVGETISRSGQAGVGSDLLSRLSAEPGQFTAQPSITSGGVSLPQYPTGGPAPDPRVILAVRPPGSVELPEPGPEPGESLPTYPEGGPAPDASELDYSTFDQGGYQAEQERRQAAGEEAISPYEYVYGSF
jgi:hypothetical protein